MNKSSIYLVQMPKLCRIAIVRDLLQGCVPYFRRVAGVPQLLRCTAIVLHTL